MALERYLQRQEKNRQRVRECAHGRGMGRHSFTRVRRQAANQDTEHTETTSARGGGTCVHAPFSVLIGFLKRTHVRAWENVSVYAHRAHPTCVDFSTLAAFLSKIAFRSS